MEFKNHIISIVILALFIVLGMYAFFGGGIGQLTNLFQPTSIQFSSTTPNVQNVSSASTTLATSTTSVDPSVFETNSLLKNMKLTFDEEFNSFSYYADSNGNVMCEPGGTGRWQTVYNFCSRTNPGNNEEQVYIDQAFLSYLKKESVPAALKDSEYPFSVSNGILAIKADRSSPLELAAVGPWAKYTSGLITTQFSFSQTYGYFEIRAKLPAGKGLWPAFWLLPTDETWPPEIDVFESFGAQSPQGEGGKTLIHYASHALKQNESCGNWYNVGADITHDFHTYGVDVEPSGITYYFDGKPYITCTANSAVNKPLYMLINLAVGATWPGSPDSSNTWPAYMYVDYVRAYQKAR
jgi:beta-glucanase (GH16 family)